MNTRQAEYRTDIARLAEAAAERETRMVERATVDRWWQTAIFTAVTVSAIGIATTVIIAVLG